MMDISTLNTDASYLDGPDDTPHLIFHTEPYYLDGPDDPPQHENDLGDAYMLKEWLELWINELGDSDVIEDNMKPLLKVTDKCLKEILKLRMIK